LWQAALAGFADEVMSVAMSMIDESSSFEVTTSFEGRRAVVALHGRVESLDAFDLWAALAGAIDHLDRQVVVLDLAGLSFIGAAGLVALANAEQSFAEAGVELTIRTPPRLLQRFLSAMEMADVARLDQALARLGRLGREQVGESHDMSPLRISQDPIVNLKRVTAVPTDSGVVDGALRLVVELAQTAVNGADGVSVSLLRNGTLRTVAATDETIMEMDTDQYATGEGPCVDASRRGHWFHAESLDTESRWPSFTPQARALGIMSILSSPLTALEDPVGALNIYSRTPSIFDTEAQQTAASFAAKASSILGDARAGVTDAQLAARFHQALRNREIIATAKGIVMERESLDEDDAFENLLRQSIKSGVSLLTRAEAFARSTGQPELEREHQPDD
jgi:anti-anti-sigma regulatory factor